MTQFDPFTTMVCSLRIRCMLSAVIWSAMMIAHSASANPPITVPVDSYLPADNSNKVALVSPNGMFNLIVETWPDQSSPSSSFCMAAVNNLKINPGPTSWAANNAEPLPVTSSCRLFFSADGDLLLQKDHNSTAMWRTGTAGMGASSLSLLDSGNLVVQTKQGSTIWQSFSHSPFFAIYTGMNFSTNSTLFETGAVSADAPTDVNKPGNYAMQIQKDNVVLFTNKDNTSRFVYWSSPITGRISSSTRPQLAYAKIGADGLTFYDENSGLVGRLASTVQVPYQYSNALMIAMVDKQSPNFQAYYRTETSWINFYNSSISTCQNPSICGAFGLCEMNTGACSCPENFMRNTNNDCEPAIALPAISASSSSPSCSIAAGFSYSFVSVKVSFAPQLNAISSPSAGECTSTCLQSCTCNAALFDPGTMSCSLFSALPTVGKHANSTQLMFLKVAEHHKKNLAVIVGAACGAVMASLCLFCTMAVMVCRLKKKRTLKQLEMNEEAFLQALPRLPPRFTYGELDMATNNFSKKLGAGGFGEVYEGVAASGVKLAVKRLEGKSGQSSAQFRAEVASIGSVSHVNLVILKGFCHEGEARLLVYEHMANGSLDRWLFQESEEKKETAVLSWETRCRIATDTAKGLAYLHHECGEHIVHCDVKPENILLDEDLNAKVGDFGLAKLVDTGCQSFAMTTLKGTRGYLAPEWLQQATITAKSDVYSYGVVLLEIISGRRCLGEYGYLPTLAFQVASSSSSNSGTLRWGSSSSFSRSAACTDQVQCEEHGASCLSGRYDVGSSAGSLTTLLLDARLSAESVPGASLERMVYIGLWCVQPDPSSRPPMNVVVQMLEGLASMPPPPLQHSPVAAPHNLFNDFSSGTCSSQLQALFPSHAAEKEEESVLLKGRMDSSGTRISQDAYI